MTFASSGFRLNWLPRLPKPKPHPGIIGVLVCGSVMVIEKRLPSASIAFTEVVSFSLSASAGWLRDPAPALDEGAAKVRGELGDVASIFSGSPQGGMSGKARLRSI